MNTDYTNIMEVFSHNIVCENFATNFHKLAPIFMGCELAKFGIFARVWLICGCKK